MTQRDEQGRVGSGQDALAMNQGMRVLSHLVAGVGLYGGLGWLGDHVLHTGFLLPLGILLGAALGVYTTIRRLAVAGEDAATTQGAGPRGTSTQHTTTQDARVPGATEGER